MTTTTIGDVLNQLRDEFDDITISKIRFLEAEGLISPDRTDSGYRKFTQEDVDRLRYVLRAQRDRYLPLKIIKDELDRMDADQVPIRPEEGSPDTVEPDADLGRSTTSAQPNLLDPAGNDSDLTDGELTAMAGLSADQLAALREHGLLGNAPHDASSLTVARTASELLSEGLEVRHLRMYRQFADREAALIEQRVTPALRQRNPDSRRRAMEATEQLVALGSRLHRALLASSLQQILRG